MGILNHPSIQGRIALMEQRIRELEIELALYKLKDKIS